MEFVCFFLPDALCLLIDDCCLLCAVCCLLFAVDVCCVLVVWLLFVGRCALIFV